MGLFKKKEESPRNFGEEDRLKKEFEQSIPEVPNMVIQENIEQEVKMKQEKEEQIQDVEMEKPMNIDLSFTIKTRNAYIDLMNFKYDMIEKYGIEVISNSREEKKTI